jgi:hypothetical protein
MSEALDVATDEELADIARILLSNRGKFTSSICGDWVAVAGGDVCHGDTPLQAMRAAIKSGESKKPRQPPQGIVVGEVPANVQTELEKTMREHGMIE